MVAVGAVHPCTFAYCSPMYMNFEVIFAAFGPVTASGSSSLVGPVVGASDSDEPARTAALTGGCSPAVVLATGADTGSTIATGEAPRLEANLSRVMSTIA